MHIIYCVYIIKKTKSCPGQKTHITEFGFV